MTSATATSTPAPTANCRVQGTSSSSSRAMGQGCCTRPRSRNRMGAGRVTPGPESGSRPPQSDGAPSGGSVSRGLGGRLLRLRGGVLREVAGDLVTRGELEQRGLLGLADVLRLPAAGVEAARGRRVDRAGHVTLE